MRPRELLKIVSDDAEFWLRIEQGIDTPIVQGLIAAGYALARQVTPGANAQKLELSWCRPPMPAAQRWGDDRGERMLIAALQ
jgi:hypothetical protein